MGFWTRRGQRRDERGRFMTPDDLHEDLVPTLPGEPALSATADADVTPSPVSRERIAHWFKENNFHYFVDVDNDLGGLWHSRLFFFFLLGDHEEILQIRSQWNRDVSIERLDEVLPFCNDWNAQRVWPKTYVRVHDNGVVQVCAETAVDLEQGATDDQLALQLICGLSSQSLFWDALDDVYPDHVASAP